LLEGLLNTEALHVVEDTQGEGLVNSKSGKLIQPGVLECDISRRSVFFIVGEELADEVLGLVRDVLPDFVLEVELSLSDLLHDVLIALTIERWLSREEDISDDTARPDIALVVVVLVENFWGNVVWGSELLIKVLAWVIDKRGTKINDLDGIELLVSFQQNVFGFKVSVDNVILVTIVNTLKNLLHQDSSVTLTELSPLKNLVKQFSSLADFCNKIVSFLVLKEFVHFDDVWMVNFLEDVDLVEEHALLVFIHIALPEDLDSSLGIGFSVHTHTNLSKGTSTENFSNSVVVSQFSLSLSNVVRSSYNLLNHGLL